MSLDEILMEFTDRKQLVRRRALVDPLATIGIADKDGLVKGRTADGKPMTAKIGGKSLARRLMEQEEARQKEAKNGN